MPDLPAFADLIADGLVDFVIDRFFRTIVLVRRRSATAASRDLRGRGGEAIRHGNTTAARRLAGGSGIIHALGRTDDLAFWIVDFRARGDAIKIQIRGNLRAHFAIAESLGQ